MFRHTKTAHLLDRFLARLPLSIYLVIYPRLIAQVNRSRSTHNTRFKRGSDNTIVALFDNNSILYIYEKTRLSLYCWPNGLSHRLSQMLTKYQHGDVYVREGDVVVDVGANIGEFSIAVAPIAALTYAFEPDPVPYRCLILNSANAKTIVPVARALSDRSEKVTFYHAPETADSSIVMPSVPHRSTTVHTITLDDFFLSRNQRVDFLKVEAEGWEPEVLRGATGLLSSTVSRVAVDAGPERNGQSTSKEVIEILLKHNFTVTVKKDMVYGHRVPPSSQDVNNMTFNAL